MDLHPHPINRGLVSQNPLLYRYMFTCPFNITMLEVHWKLTHIVICIASDPLPDLEVRWVRWLGSCHSNHPPHASSSPRNSPSLRLSLMPWAKISAPDEMFRVAKSREFHGGENQPLFEYIYTYTYVSVCKEYHVFLLIHLHICIFTYLCHVCVYINIYICICYLMCVCACASTYYINKSYYNMYIQLWITKTYNPFALLWIPPHRNPDLVFISLGYDWVYII